LRRKKKKKKKEKTFSPRATQLLLFLSFFFSNRKKLIPSPVFTDNCHPPIFSVISLFEGIFFCNPEW